MKQIYNPFLPLDEYVPDGEAHVFGDRVYVYGSHDKENGEAFCMLDYVCYSAPVSDLKDWRYEGVIYKSRQEPNYDRFPYMFAPDVVRGNDGRYYLYYSSARYYPDCSYIMSVAVCDTPAGEYEFLGHLKNPDGTLFTEGVIFDPGLINDQGAIRLYYGMQWDFEEKMDRESAISKQMEMFSKTREQVENGGEGVMGAFTVEIMDDMITAKGKPTRILPRLTEGTDFEKHPFFEASSMRKINGKYYFIYSSFNGHELCYATSDHPDRDFKFKGVIVSNGDIGLNGREPKDRLMRTGNNHGSIEKINGEWYIFYHRHTTKTELSRQACAERIQLLPNGEIPQVEITSCGLNGSPLVAQGTYPAVICCNLTNGNMPQGHCEDKTLPHIVCKNGKRVISEVGDNTLIGYKYFLFDSDVRLCVRLYTEDGRGEIKVILGDTPACSIFVAPEKDWQDKEAEITGIRGKQPLYLKYEGEGLMDIAEITFKK
ncbi:MAG: family 43 glycosylhydrolase [Clostridia bacterium]|nr:family 43 glycosylhydrolase [Clostridia bacterium]